MINQLRPSLEELRASWDAAHPGTVRAVARGNHGGKTPLSQPMESEDVKRDAQHLAFLLCNALLPSNKPMVLL
jgi:hypothetical protein